MDSGLAKSALLNTSAATDVKRSGGEVSITDLLSFDIDNLLTAGQKIYRAEVRQVVGINVNAVTKTANTRYSIRIGNVLNEYEAGQEALKVYAYTSGSAVPTNADIIAGLVAAVNNTSISNYVSAADASPTINITDDAGYYPIRPAGRAGPSTVVLGDNMSGAVLTVSTAGVVGYGVGAYILSNVPVKDPMTGNLISGELDTPSGAVSGQNYDGFHMTYTKEVNHQAVSGLRAEKVLRQLIYVDNGTGTSTANLAGYGAFLREFEKLVYHRFTKDPNSIIEFFEMTGTMFDNDGIGVPTSGDGDENILNVASNQWRYYCEGATAGDPIGSNLTSGFNMNRASENSGDGIEFSAEIGALSPQEYVVGQQAFSFKTTVEVTDVSGSADFALGLRIKAAYTDDTGTYTDYAAIGWNAAANPADIDIRTNLNNAGEVSTDTLVNWADTETHTIEIQVAVDGTATFLLDGVDKSSLQTTAFVFDAGDTIIPFIKCVSSANLVDAIFCKKWFSHAGVLSY